VGIRLLDHEGNIPYQGYTGFSREFYERESPLSIRTDECMCISVITGKTDPGLPFFTPGGSFFMNGTSRFLASVPEEDKGRTRNVCNETGYESVALIPIRQGNAIIGLIHLADRQENKAPLRHVQVLEEVAVTMGAAIQRVAAEERLRISLDEKDVLLKEVHHRVKNNLATITALLNLQRRGLDDEGTADSLRELGSRITSMALVHESLYRTGNLAVIRFQDYLKTLIPHLRTSYGARSSMRIRVDADVEMGLDEAIPCGLIVCELVTNALKHAFPEGMVSTGADQSEINVTARRDDDRYVLSVADNGRGIPGDVDPSSEKTLGLRIVRMLGEHQLGGSIDMDRAGGTRFTIRFRPRNRR
jgi:two-component sensor histidine kinase